MEKAKAMRVLIVILFLCSSKLIVLSQLDTTGFDLNKLSKHEMEIKDNWDDYLFQGGNWKEALTNRAYVLDCNQIFVFEYLTRLGVIDVNEELYSQYTVFAHACQCGNTYLFYKGLSQSVDLNRVYQGGNTALLYSIKNGHAEIVKAILGNNVDINKINENGETALTLAAQYINDINIINYILSKENVDIFHKRKFFGDTIGYNSLELSYYWGGDNVFNRLLKHFLLSCDPSFWKKSRMVDMCIGSGDTILLKKILPLYDPKISIERSNYYFTRAFEFAEYYNLLNKYRDPAPDTTSSLYSTKDLDIGIFKVLVDYGYLLNSLNDADQNVLFKCKDIAPVAKFLVTNGININQVDKFDKTPLQYYIDEIIKPPRYEFGITLKEPDRDYTQELELLKFYVDNRAVIGKESRNGWHYIYDKAKQENNYFLIRCLEDKYAEYIK